MTRAAYYNEFDAYPAQWLRNLADAGHITQGAIDARSIRDVAGSDIGSATRAHFFAGIGVWDYALQLAGWPADVPVWTGSCPCQPFSAAGKRKGDADERHLWPEWRRLIAECRPSVVFGEQVASADGRTWLASVRADLEALGYAVGAADLCAAGAGAPHIRQRLFFVGVADALHAGWAERGAGAGGGPPAGGRVARGVADAAGQRCAGERVLLRSEARGRDAGEVLEVARSGVARGVADATDVRFDGRRTGEEGGGRDAARVQSERLCDARGVADAHDVGPQGHGRPVGVDDAEGRDAEGRHHPAFGVWGNPDWVQCSDGKARPTQSGLFPLAHGAAGRVGRLRAYGNAIVPQVAATFIRAVVETLR